MSTKEKVLSRAELVRRRASMREAGERLVFTNGCFDLLHPGHLRYLSRARSLGDRLAVAVNDDATVRKLKGPTRPLVGVAERMELLAALGSVDFVVSFTETTPAEIIRAVLPDVLVKGGDWTPDKIVGRDSVEAAGGEVRSLAFAEGYSTTGIIDRIVERLGGARRGAPE